MLDGNCTFNVLVYADADSDVPLEWGDSDAKEIKNGEKVQLRSFSTNSHRVDTLVSYRYVDSVMQRCVTHSWVVLALTILTGWGTEVSQATHRDTESGACVRSWCHVNDSGVIDLIEHGL